VEQHAFLSLATDAILAERVALEAAEPLGVPVFPAIPYGLAPYFAAYPGTVTLRPGTYAALVVDVLDSLADAGFRRILLVNGHGGNAAVAPAVQRWTRERPGVRTALHHWWRAPRTREAVEAVGGDGGHANWMESFPWTRSPGVGAPQGSKPSVSLTETLRSDPAAVRRLLGDGSFGGDYERPDEVMLRIWDEAVAETRALLEGGAWPGDAPRGGEGAS
jgi:creatinine amidohydrolase